MQNNLHTDGPIDKKDAAGRETTPLSSQHFTFESAKFYTSIVAPGEFGIVAAESGGMKTMFLCNLACVRAMSGSKVGIVSVQMATDRIWRRIYCMLADFPTEQLDTAEGRERLSDLMKACQYTKNIILGEVLEFSAITPLVDEFARQGCSVVIIDGFDSVEHQQASLMELNKLIAGLPALAKQLNISLWISSQVTSSADGAEIIRQNELSATRAKAQEAAVIITLGHRLKDQLLTAMVIKSRSGPNEQKYPAYRLILRSSLRLEVISDRCMEIAINQNKPPPSERINAYADDFPGEEDGEDDEFGKDEVEPTDTGSSQPYHGKKGFVPLGRAVFHSAIFKNRDYEQFYWLMDLYEMAWFRSGDISAPGTDVPVSMKPGQVMTSWNMLAKKWKLKGYKRVRTFLKRAEAAGLITQERVLADGTRISTKGATSSYTQTVLCTVITLCNYELNKKGGKHDVDDSG